MKLAECIIRMAIGLVLWVIICVVCTDLEIREFTIGAFCGTIFMGVMLCPNPFKK